jgi:hypothetical protein
MPFTPADALLEFTMRTAKDGKSVMTVQRPALIEPSSILFGAESDSDRRFAINVMLLTPAAWSGPLPE